ncbi:hypothetical protein LSUE1_G003834, partial [Lachnellula suecica]
MSSRIHPRSPVSLIQETINNAIGKTYWVGQEARWRNPMWRWEARNSFIRERLARDGLSPRQFKDLDITQKRYRANRLESAFSRDFFRYTRDGSRMAEATGETGDWIRIEVI